MFNEETTQSNFDESRSMDYGGNIKRIITHKRHITAKFSGWFTSILCNQYSNWCVEFYKLASCEEFEGQWTQVMEKYDMLTNKHVIGLYQIKYFWVSCYLCGHFFGGVTTIRRTKSINAFIKWFVSSHINLIQLIKQASQYLSLISFVV